MMTIRVDFYPVMEARLVTEARCQGAPLEKLAERLLKETLTKTSLPHVILTVHEFHHMLHVIAKGSEKLSNLPTESFSRRKLLGGPARSQRPLIWSIRTCSFVGSSRIPAILRSKSPQSIPFFNAAACLCYTTQNLGEFRNARTRRPDHNGWSFSTKKGSSGKVV
jgi:hypothetical protein